MQGEKYPKHYCRKCGSQLVRIKGIKITSYNTSSGKPIYTTKLGCPKRTIFTHRTSVKVEKRG
jgi:hypothetical protein